MTDLPPEVREYEEADRLYDWDDEESEQYGTLARAAIAAMTKQVEELAWERDYYSGRTEVVYTVLLTTGLKAEARCKELEKDQTAWQNQCADNVALEADNAALREKVTEWAAVEIKLHNENAALRAEVENMKIRQCEFASDGVCRKAKP